MRRAFAFLPSLTAIAAAAVILAGAVNGAGHHTLAQAQAAGWDCDPLILIGGHYHCSPAGQARRAGHHRRHGDVTEHRPPGLSAGWHIRRDRDPDPRRPVRRAALPDRSVAARPAVAARTDVLRLPPLRVHPVGGVYRNTRTSGDHRWSPLSLAGGTGIFGSLAELCERCGQLIELGPAPGDKTFALEAEGLGTLEPV